MNNMKVTKTDVFLSFAEKDHLLAALVCELFQKEFGMSVFFAHQNLPRGSADFRNEIIRGIQTSRCFVPILTWHSADRPWVTFESGAAEARGLAICRTRTADIPDSKINKSPSGSQFTYHLFEDQGLVDLVARIKDYLKAESGSNNRQEIQVRIQNSSLAKRIKKLSGSRSVFIAGSIPKHSHQIRKMAIASNGLISENEIADQIVRSITTGLLDAGFKLCSSLDVDVFGLQVLYEVAHWCEVNGCRWDDVFTIGGQLRFDVPLNGNRFLKEMVQVGFRKSREVYLKDQEWLLILGGNERSQIEFEVAKKLGTKICALPFFGGTAQVAYEELSRNTIQPITSNQRSWNQEQVRILVQHLMNN